MTRAPDVSRSSRHHSAAPENGLAPVPVVLAASKPLLVYGLEATLRVNRAITIRGVATTVRELEPLVLRTPAAVVVSELTLDGHPPLAVRAFVRDWAPAAPLVFVASTFTAAALFEAMRAGGAALIATAAAVEETVSLLVRVARGEHMLVEQVLADRDASRAVVSAYAAFGLDGRFPTQDLLTVREHEVLRGLALGRTNQELATEFGVGVATIKTHCVRLYARLGVDNRTAAVRVGIEHGLIPIQVLREAVAADRAQRERQEAASELRADPAKHVRRS